MSHPVRLVVVSFAFVALACAPSRGDRDARGGRASPASEPVTRQPEHTTLAEAAPRPRAVVPLARAHHDGRATTARRREPVVSGLTIPRMTPDPAGAGAAPIVSLPSRALVSPPPAPMSAPTVQGLPEAPQQYGRTMTNFGPTGPVLGTSPGMSTPSSLGASSSSFASGGH